MKKEYLIIGTIIVVLIVVLVGIKAMVEQPGIGGSTRLPNSDLSAKTITSTGALTVNGTTSLTSITGSGTLDLTTSTATSTSGFFLRLKPAATATTTLSVGSQVGDGTKGCIEMLRSDNTYARIIVDGTTLNVAAGRCN